MGHYTTFKLRMEYEDNDDEIKILEWVDQHYDEDKDSYSDDASYDLINAIRTGEVHCRKWYESKEEMIDFSAQFPRVLSVLDCSSHEGFGEWRYYFKAGKHYYVEPELPQFDESRLKST